MDLDKTSSNTTQNQRQQRAKNNNSRQQQYRSAWEKEKTFSGWLKPIVGDVSKAFCILCNCKLLAHKKDLVNHARSKKHVDSKTASASSTSIRDFVRFDIPGDRKIAELKLAAFIAEHCSINTVDHLGTLLSTLDKSSNILTTMKLHRTKCTALITNVISPCMIKALKEEVGNGAYSMIIDESTSVDTKKMLCVIIRFFNCKKSQVTTTFYRLLEVEGGDANTLTNAFKNQLSTDGLNVKNLVGIGVDGASVMVGEHHSFSTILKEIVPHLTVVKCVSHSLHLATENACKMLPSNLDYIVRECHNWFSCSTKRQVEYAALYDTMMGKNPLKIDKLSGTRWLARYGAVVKILHQWDVLLAHFTLAKDKERCFAAGQLHLMLSADSNKLYLVFLKWAMKPITDCNCMFQGDNVEPLKLFTELRQLLLNYLSILVPPQRLSIAQNQDLCSFNFKDCIMSLHCIYLGFEFSQTSTGMDKNELRIIQERCVNFLIELCVEIQKRIPRNFKLLEKMAFFTPKNATSQVRPNIDDIVSEFKDIVGSEHVDAVLNQWRILPLIQWHQTSSTELFWSNVLDYENAVGDREFQMLGRFVTSILSLPFSNASVERAFSMVNVVKSKLRNRLLTKTADHIMRVRYALQNTGCVNFEPTKEMLKKFNSNEIYKIENNTDEMVEEVLELFSD